MHNSKNSYHISFSDLTINRKEIFYNLGYGEHKPEKYIENFLEESIEKVSHICKAKALFIISPGELIDKNYLKLNNTSIEIGKTIANYYKLATHFSVFVATAGNEFEAYLHDIKNARDPMALFVIDALGSEIVEATQRYITNKISEEAFKSGCSITYPYSPGYCSWHVKEQKALFELLPNEPCGVTINDMCLMKPIKSISGIVGIGKNIVDTPHGCKTCSLKNCYKRKL